MGQGPSVVHTVVGLVKTDLDARLIVVAQASLETGDPGSAVRAMDGLHQHGRATPQTCLILAEGLGSLEHYERQREVLAQLYELAPEDVDVHLSAAHLARRSQQRMTALGHAKRSVKIGSNRADAWTLLFEVQHDLCRHAEAAESLRAAVRLLPGDASLVARCAQVHMASRDYTGALEVLAEVRASGITEPYIDQLFADLAVRLKISGHEEAIDAADDPAGPGWLRTVCRWLELGRIDRAEQALEAAAPEHGDTALWFSAKSRMALWRGDTAEAHAWAQRALERDDGLPEAHFVIGAAAVLCGDHEAGRAALQVALKTPRPLAWLSMDTVHCFLAESHLASRRYDQAISHADRAMNLATDYSVAAHLLRMLPLTHQTRVIDKRFTEMAKRVQGLTGTSTFIRGKFEHALQRMGGNRSAWTTSVDAHGVISAYEVPPYPTHLARLLQLQIRCRPMSDVLAAFEALGAQYPDDPTVHTYWGEVLVWCGDAEAAAERFSRAIEMEHGTTWAWIGLGASQMLQCRYDTALKTWAKGIQAARFEGPTVFVYRGEARRRMGELQRARADLERATADKPQRLSAWLNRALLDAATGHPGPASRLASRIRTTNPGLWADALTAASQAEASPSDVTTLETILTLMRGNRSSSIFTYFSVDGALRFARWMPQDGPEELR